MYSYHFFGRDAVFFNDDIARPVAHSYHSIGGFHTAFFDVVHQCIAVVLAPAVVFGGVYVYNKGFARNLLSNDTCTIGKPVVGVNYVKLIAFGNGTRN